MARKFKLNVRLDREVSDIVAALEKRGLYAGDLLYRVFTVEEGDVAERVREVLRRGTDRTSDEVLSEEDGFHNLDLGEDYDVRVNGRYLRPSEYVWAAEEGDLEGQLMDTSGPSEFPIPTFVAVYARDKMKGVFEAAYMFKGDPKDAMVALIQVQYKQRR
tara:strand:+ start:30017 stop:30496 length:480 start_codon:yes stop_codon:yes gene_type:complete